MTDRKLAAITATLIVWGVIFVFSLGIAMSVVTGVCK